MKTNFIEELKWRGMLHDVMPGTEELLNKEVVTGYIGFDPTADSLHVGSLAQIMTLVRFQLAGHKPLALVGGATGMVGDPSGKSAERNLLDADTLNKNVEGIKSQLMKFLDFNDSPNGAELVNNYDWFKNYSFLDFIRDAGKHITVNYMMAKDSVKNRINGETGMSFTEFSYQLIQGYDFYHLWKEKNCKVQMGGSDQWGNITTGTEFIRRKASGEAFALTTQLIKKSDGTKFGKSEGGNIWLDRDKTSPYKFYQFWLNVSDEDAKSYIRIFTLLSQEEIVELEGRHSAAPHERHLQKALAKDITIRVHNENDYLQAIETADFLFKSKPEDVAMLDPEAFEKMLGGIDTFEVNKNDVENGINLVDLLVDKTTVFPSKTEARKMVTGNAISVNKVKTTDINAVLNLDAFTGKQYLLISKGKKENYLIKLI
ncbi:MAG: tyrosine--tRNA ligase [Bacteroidota bacterium]|jgi:tyrosyl-tRNA synthetase|nr:tyrosine--tRNA ligase [Bacteroidota bacterium]